MSGIDVLDAALIAHARTLYFQFVKLKFIAKETGIDIKLLRKLAYGTGEDDETSWFNERRASFEDDYLEAGERNRFVAHEYASHAIDFMHKSIIALNVPVGADGKQKPIEPINPHDMDKLASSLVKVDKLLRLSTGLPTDIVGYKDATETPLIAHQTIDVNAVAMAITKDKAMQRHLNRIKEQHGKEENNGTEQLMGNNGSDASFSSEGFVQSSDSSVEKQRSGSARVEHAVDTIETTARIVDRRKDESANIQHGNSSSSSIDRDDNSSDGFDGISEIDFGETGDQRTSDHRAERTNKRRERAAYEDEYS